MAEKLTPQQEMAVCNRGGKLLVSAAAGSGKTKVLVDRLMSYLLDANLPANLDDFLIITYTKAAASELRGKIAAKLSQRIAEDPQNKHLQRQMQRLYLTKISTVHSFCADVLREYAYLIDLPSDFRVADENECRQLRENCMARVLDAAYLQSDDPDFRAFVDSQGLGRDDRLVPQILMKVYDSARCHLQPKDWLERCINNADTHGLTDPSQTVWGEYLIRDLHRYVDLQIRALGWCADAAESTEMMEKVAALLRATLAQLQQLRNCSCWNEILQFGQIDYGRLTIPKQCPDALLGEKIKAVRNACKKGLEKRLLAFRDSGGIVLDDLTKSAAAIRGMINLVRAFETEFNRVKRIKRIVDFGDLEHRMLDLLLGKSRSGPTVAASEIGRRFREIMVDEYQDSNAVQDAIFSALTAKRQNCFMVGDVKQSIYQFRLADPTIFLEKYESYVRAEDAVGNEGRKIMLSHNFRSGGAVLAGVNDVFETCMSPSVGGLYYGEDERLREGIAHTPLGEPEVELWAVNVQESSYDEEAAFVAKRIAELTDGTHFVRDEERIRPIRVDDVAILLRSPNSVGSYFKDALAAIGIKCSTGGGDDLLQSQEVATLYAILQVISNPRQDIPLIAALASPVFSITADALSVLRAKNKDCSMYDAVLRADEPEIKTFLNYLSQWRREARLKPLSQLIESIFCLTHMDSIYAAMPGGEIRSRNLQLFYQLAVEYESGNQRDLEQFLDHILAMQDKGLMVEAQQSSPGTVTIMSIHKSKGLEFPVVFVCGLSRAFNRESVRAQVLCDQELGLGLTAVDEKNRVRYPTVAKRAIAAKIIADSVSEEMRVLYVALTRARDRLIMTYASSSLEKDLQELALRMDVGSNELLTQEVVCGGEWVLMAALRRTEAGELFAFGSKPAHTQPGEPPWLIRVCESSPLCENASEEESQRYELSDQTAQELRERLAFRYGHPAATTAPSKQTATQRKGRQKDSEASENAQTEQRYRYRWRQPSFMDKRTDGTQIGNATHALMQYIRYERCIDLQSIEQEIARLVQENYLTAEQGRLVDTGAIAAFFATSVGRLLQTHPNVLREFKFSILDDGVHYSQDLQDEKILLQGVVDCAMIDDDGITVIDFKTDYVTEESLPEKVDHYRAQVQAYADAMQRIYGLPVKTGMLYFFRMNRFVTVL